MQSLNLRDAGIGDFSADDHLEPSRSDAKLGTHSGSVEGDRLRKLFGFG
jgi:hypothetical protein